jgi:hypothetical protein
MKTVKDYLKDPRMLSDPDMAKAMKPVKEIHAIRLMIQDEKARIGETEYNKRLRASLAQRGISICYDLTNQGKMKPRQPVTQ